MGPDSNFGFYHRTSEFSLVNVPIFKGISLQGWTANKEAHRKCERRGDLTGFTDRAKFGHDA